MDAVNSSDDLQVSVVHEIREHRYTWKEVGQKADENEAQLDYK